MSPEMHALHAQVENAIDAHERLSRYTVGTVAARALFEVKTAYVTAEILVRLRGWSAPYLIHETGATLASAAANLVASLDGWADAIEGKVAA